MGFPPDFAQLGKSTHNHFCHTPRALSVQAVDVWCYVGPQKYQQVIRDELRGCEGVANIVDDLVVHGKGVEEHDRRLFAVLDRLSEAGLTSVSLGWQSSRFSVMSCQAMALARVKRKSPLSEMQDLLRTRARFDRLWGWFSTPQGSCQT